MREFWHGTSEYVIPRGGIEDGGVIIPPADTVVGPELLAEHWLDASEDPSQLSCCMLV
jgi:hypothetical protein